MIFLIKVLFGFADVYLYFANFVRAWTT